MTTKNLLALVLAGGLALSLSASTTLAQADKGGTGTKATQPEKDKKENKDKSKMDGKSEGAKVGEKAPAFELTDTDGKKYTLADLTKEKKIVVIEWFNPTCPYVKKHYENGATTMTSIAKEYKDKNVIWLSVSTGGTKEELAAAKKDWKIDAPILLDTDGKAAGAYGSKNTPTMYIIGADGTLVYRGAIDDNNSADTVGKTNYVRTALDQTIKGETVTTPETKAYGCRVKGPKA